MALPAIEMPATVPDWVTSPHDHTLSGPFADVPFVMGSRKRRVATAGTMSIEAGMVLNEAQASAVHTWFEDTLEAGWLPFAARTIGPDGTRQFFHARFASQPQWAMIPGALVQWQMSASLRIEGEAE